MRPATNGAPVLLGLSAVLLVGCFEPQLPAEISCRAGACPPGLACAPDRICRRAGGNDDAGALESDGSGPAPDSQADLPCVDQFLGTSFDSVDGSTRNANNDWFECDGEDSPDVTFAWTAPTDGTFSFDTCGSAQGFDTVLAAFDGCSPPARACNDDFIPCDLASKVSVDLTEGETIVVVVDGLFSSGDFKLNVSQGE